MEDLPVEPAAALTGLPATGRRFAGRGQVRLGHADPEGRLRLDALAGYLQDVASDDAADAGLEEALAWVVRRLMVDCSGGLPRLGEEVELTTWCSGWGSRWAERRTTVRSPSALVETAAVWVQVDGRGRPVPLTERFHDLYDAAAGGRRVSSRLSLADPPAGLDWRAWALRRTDLDLFGHVNNAAYLHAVEEVRAGRDVRQVIVEYRQPLTFDDQVVLGSSGDALWLRQGGIVCAAARLSAGSLR